MFKPIRVAGQLALGNAPAAGARVAADDLRLLEADHVSTRRAVVLGGHVVPLGSGCAPLPLLVHRCGVVTAGWFGRRGQTGAAAVPEDAGGVAFAAHRASARATPRRHDERVA